MRRFTLTVALAAALVLVSGPPAAATTSGAHIWYGSVYSTSGAGRRVGRGRGHQRRR